MVAQPYFSFDRLWLLAAIAFLPAVGRGDPLDFNYQQLNYPGAQNTVATGINDAGVIAGYFWNTSGADRGFTLGNVWSPPIDVASSYATDIYGINNSKTLVGSYNSGIYVNGNFTVDQGFIIPNGKAPQNLAPPDATLSEDYGINDEGDVVGSSFSATGAAGYVFDGKTFASISCADGASAFPHGINDKGQIVGFCKESDGQYTGFLTSLGNLSSLTTIGPSGAYDNFAYGINSQGLIVGVTEAAQGGPYQGFLFNPNGDTYQLLNFPGAANTYAAGINNRDQIVGWFDGNYSAFLATPVPEPASWMLTGLILVPLGRRVYLARKVRLAHVPPRA